jgi:glycine betaine/proline transport system permease protein
MLAGAIMLALFLLAPHVAFVDAYPETFVVPFADWLSAAADWFIRRFRDGFRFIAGILSHPLRWGRMALEWLPWPATVVAVSAIGYAAAGWRLALFTFAAMMYMAVTGYWDRSMYTLAIVVVAVPVSVLTGLLIGILAFRSRLARLIVQPCLDLMQTIPTFAYLIPILLLFGLGPVVGMVATAIYAIPPMVRNVMLGLERVPMEIVESARMSGSTSRQLLWWVQLPVAMPTVLIGVNQTIMAGLSMVVIASILGGFPDIGLEVFTTMKKAQFGQSILAGLVIALMAMMMDRISRGFASRQLDPRLRKEGTGVRRRILGASLAVIALCSLLAVFWPEIGTYPESLVFYPAASMNHALEWFTRTFFVITSALKTWSLFYFLLPLKVGMVDSVRPRYWGFEITAVSTTVYALLVLVLVFVSARWVGWRAAVGVAIAGVLYFFGTTGIPWLAFILIVGVTAFLTGGWRVCSLAVAGLLFIAVAGMWSQAMISVQLCGAGVIISFLLGATLGVWAALNDRVSRFLRPINDTLQTMPIFVFLIPGIMVFLTGEFTALVAIVMYATVPSIRYTEHGIRNVPPHVIEAARSFGVTRRQLLWQVLLPMALPEIMLGLNQTIMMGLAMVVVASLVGAKGLGQEVMVALTWADLGRGIVSGFSVALIAIITDQIIQSWSSRKKRDLGLADAGSG